MATRPVTFVTSRDYRYGMSKDFDSTSDIHKLPHMVVSSNEVYLRVTRFL